MKLRTNPDPDIFSTQKYFNFFYFSIKKLKHRINFQQLDHPSNTLDESKVSCEIKIKRT